VPDDEEERMAADEGPEFIDFFVCDDFHCSDLILIKIYVPKSRPDGSGRASAIHASAGNSGVEKNKSHRFIGGSLAHHRDAREINP
jgi:hypothetical protein